MVGVMVIMATSFTQCRRPGFDPWVGKIPLEEEMAIHSKHFSG